MSDSKELTFQTGSPQETVELGRRMGELLQGGEVIGLTGELGTGKTHLVKGITEGTGAGRRDRVSSPTFVLVHEYAGPESKLEIYHIDAYRLESPGEFERLGFDELCHPEGVVLIEWADKVEEILSEIDIIDIHLSHEGEDLRNICCKNLPAYLYNALK